MTNYEFIDYIKTQEAYQELLEQYNPSLIYLGGSRANGHHLDESDWDLIAIVDEKVIDQLGCKNVTIKNDLCLPVHSMIVSIQHLVGLLTNNLNYNANLHIMMFFMSGFKAFKELCIYSDETSYIYNLFDFIAMHSHEITEICIYNFIERMNLQLNHICETMELKFNSKIYYNLLTAYDILYNTNSSILIIKLRKKEKLTTDQIKELCNKMKQLKNFLINYNDTSYDVFRSLLEVQIYG